MVFIRRVENFDCDNCGASNRGDGYTNHCRRCLYSKHVDVEPGDRLEGCLGMMAPVGVELRSGAYAIAHRCLTCGAERRCRTAPADDADTVRAVSARAQPPPHLPAPRRRGRRHR